MSFAVFKSELLEITSPPIGRDTNDGMAMGGCNGLEITSPPIGRDTGDFYRIELDMRSRNYLPTNR